LPPFWRMLTTSEPYSVVSVASLIVSVFLLGFDDVSDRCPGQ
jgi:hypothetical protein